jgi:hypothetical protein
MSHTPTCDHPRSGDAGHVRGQAHAGKLGQIPTVHQAPTDDLALQTDSPLD